MAAPLTSFLKKVSRKLVGKESANQDFTHLKEAFTMASILKQLNCAGHCIRDWGRDCAIKTE